MLHYIFNLPFLITVLQGQVINITVGQDGNVFTPSNVTTNVGSTVVFTWISGMHNVVQMNDDSCTNITDNGVTSGPPIDQPGKTFILPVSVTGNFWYACEVHCASGMKGLVAIDERLPPPTTDIPIPTATSTATATVPGGVITPAPGGAYPTPISDEAIGEASLTIWIAFCLSMGTVVVVNLLL